MDRRRRAGQGAARFRRDDLVVFPDAALCVPLEDKPEAGYPLVAVSPHLRRGGRGGRVWAMGDRGALGAPVGE